MFRIFILCFMMFSSYAFAGAGNLVRTVNEQDHTYDGFDMVYQDDMRVSRQQLLNGQVIRLQSRFIWEGSGDVTCCQHALISVSQVASNDSPIVGVNRRQLWTHGVGALIGEWGLGLELWFRPQNGFGTYKGVTTDAYVWNQSNGGCMEKVNPPALPPRTLCLTTQPNSWGYLTHNPNFKLRKNVKYWVRMTIQRANDNPSFAILRADLVEDIDRPIIVQSGTVGFSINKFFPDLNQPLSSAVARTPGTPAEPSIRFDSFNQGF